MVTQEICSLLIFTRDRATLGGKTRTSTKVTSLPAMLFVKHHAEVKAFRLLCGNSAVIYTSSSSSLQGTKGCLGEAHFTLQRTGSITAHFAAFWQGTVPAFVSHPPSPCSMGSQPGVPPVLTQACWGANLMPGSAALQWNTQQ